MYIVYTLPRVFDTLLMKELLTLSRFTDTELPDFIIAVSKTALEQRAGSYPATPCASRNLLIIKSNGFPFRPSLHRREPDASNSLRLSPQTTAAILY